MILRKKNLPQYHLCKVLEDERFINSHQISFIDLLCPASLMKLLTNWIKAFLLESRYLASIMRHRYVLGYLAYIALSFNLLPDYTRPPAVLKIKRKKGKDKNLMRKKNASSILSLSSLKFSGHPPVIPEIFIKSNLQYCGLVEPFRVTTEAFPPCYFCLFLCLLCFRLFRVMRQTLISSSFPKSSIRNPRFFPLSFCGNHRRVSHHYSRGRHESNTFKYFWTGKIAG